MMMMMKLQRIIIIKNSMPSSSLLLSFTLRGSMRMNAEGTKNGMETTTCCSPIIIFRPNVRPNTQTLRPNIQTQTATVETCAYFPPLHTSGLCPTFLHLRHRQKDRYRKGLVPFWRVARVCTYFPLHPNNSKSLLPKVRKSALDKM